MIHLCPYCGINLNRPIKDGVAGCHHCNHFFDSSMFHKILSLRWMVQSFRLKSLDEIPPDDFDEEQLGIIDEYVFPDPVTHEELRKILLEKGFPKYID